MKKVSAVYLETDDNALLELWDDQGFVVGFEGPPKILLQLKDLIQKCKVVRDNVIVSVFLKHLKCEEKISTQQRKEQQRKERRDRGTKDIRDFDGFMKWLMEVKGLSHYTAITYVSRVKRYLRLTEKGENESEKIRKSYFSSALKYWEEYKESERKDLITFFRKVRLEEKKAFDQILK